MDPQIVAALACPHDGAELLEDARVLGCPHGHRFDLARQGYATLMASRPPHAGDSAAMLDRRIRVHEAGVLATVHAAVVAAACRRDGTSADASDALRRVTGAPRTAPVGIVCEVGAGPGTYLAEVLDAMPDRAGLAVDVAKAAARRAARCHPRASAIVADVWAGLPLRTGSVAVLLDIFAPRNAAEFARITAPGGTLVVTTPEPDHLAELREWFGMLDVPGGKSAEIAADLGPSFLLRAARPIRTVVPVAPSLAVDLATMGPSGHHLDPARVGSLAADMGATAIPVTIAATVTRFERRADDGTVD
jgi:23S rRNA (guanine745-N1)-methyltransferase